MTSSVEKVHYRVINYCMGLGSLTETLTANESPLKTIPEIKQNKCEPLEFSSR